MEKVGDKIFFWRGKTQPFHSRLLGNCPRGKMQLVISKKAFYAIDRDSHWESEWLGRVYWNFQMKVMNCPELRLFESVTLAEKSVMKS